ncbi:MAG: hypothetical protein ACTH6H_18495, partial [Serratia sp. (in: enterobacteria)]
AQGLSQFFLTELGVIDTRHLSNYSVVTCIRLRQSLTQVSVWGCASWAPGCNLKAIGHISAFNELTKS